jgi:hypothetical protein
MPYKFSIEDGYGLMRATDPVTLSERLEVSRELRARKDFPEGTPILLDVRASFLVPADDQARAIAALHTNLLKGHPLAYVAREGMQFSVARIMQAVIETGGGRAEVFVDYDEAIRWIRKQQIPKR